MQHTHACPHNPGYRRCREVTHAHPYWMPHNMGTVAMFFGVPLATLLVMVVLAQLV